MSVNAGQVYWGNLVYEYTSYKCEYWSRHLGSRFTVNPGYVSEEGNVVCL